MKRKAPMAETTMSGSHIRPAFSRRSDPLAAPMPITIGTRSCTVLTPMLPPAALRPRAKPFFRSG